MKILLQKAILIAMLSSVQLLSYGQTQKLLSELWTGTGGTGAMFYKNATGIDPSKNVYVAGSTINGANSDVLIQKFSRSGDLLWSQTYAATPLSIPYHAPVELLVGNTFNGLSGVYVLSTLYDTVAGDLDVMVKKYNSSGVLQWTYIHDSPNLSIDFGTAITTNGTSLFVTGASLTDSTMADFMTISLDESTGALQWETRYDNNNLQEYPAKIIHSSGTVYVTGASQDSLTGLSWSIATVGYNASTGAQISSNRINSNAVSGVDDITDFTIDNQNNLYLVGAKYGSTTNLDLAVYKLDDSLNLVWENFYDFNGLDDKGTGLKVDGAGNIFVTGYSSTNSEGTQVAVLKLDNNGNEIWKTEFGGVSSENDKGVNLVVNGEKLFVAASVVDDGNSNYKLYAMDTSGVLLTEATYSGSANLNDTPEGIAIDLDGDIIITGKEQTGATTYVNKTIKYIFDERTITFEVDTNDVPLYAENELIVRFDRSVVNTATVDKRGFVVGYLSDFVDSTAIATLNAKFGTSVERLKTYKIFQRMTTADSISISRLGDTVRVDDFWATFLITFSGTNNELAIADSLNTLPDSILHYAEPNYVIERLSVPNDSYITTAQQASLIPTVAYPNAHINMDPAWDIETGKWYAKVGVFDDPVYWMHEDFGNGTWSGSKVKGGWDFYSNRHISNVGFNNELINSHGTSCAGIIGALRNNNKGVAGIAGGDIDGAGNSGAQLFSLAISNNENFTTIERQAAAIVEGAQSTTNGYGYGLTVQNHSYGGGNYSITQDNAVTSAWRNHCTFVAARGNAGLEGNPIFYPACFADVKVLNTGASGTDGTHKTESNGSGVWESSYGNDIDFIAPGTTEIVTSTINPNFPFYSDCYSSLQPNYECFNGTSSAAPHVAGVAALMYSKHHTTAGAPNNLAPEDIEQILQKSATDKGASGYDQFNGWGLINAHAALENVNYPAYYVKHASNVSPTQTTSYNVPVSVSNPVNGVNIGSYMADRIQLDWTYVEVLPSSHEIIDWWPLEASIYKGVSSSTSITGTEWMDVTPSVTIGGNSAVFNVQTYVWWIKTKTPSGNSIYKWIPSDPSELKYAYSLHVKDNNELSIDNNEQDLGLTIFPNPTEEVINLTFVSSGTDTKLEIYDAQGKIVASPDIGYKKAGKHSVSVNVANLSTGLYLVKISAGESIITKKIIKQ